MGANVLPENLKEESAGRRDANGRIILTRILEKCNRMQCIHRAEDRVQLLVLGNTSTKLRVTMRGEFTSK